MTCHKMKFLRLHLWVTALTSTGLAVDFEHSLSLPKRTENLVFRDRVKASWLPDSRTFWYRVQTAPQEHELVLIDAATGARRTAAGLQALGLPDQAEVRSSTTEIKLRRTQRTGESSGFKFINKLDVDVDLFWINQKGEHVRFGAIRAHSEREQQTYEGHVWLITSSTGEHLAVVEGHARVATFIIDGKGIQKTTAEPASTTLGTRSPDGKWSVTVERDLVLLHDLTGGRSMRLRVQPAASAPFHREASWAPDSSAFVLSACRPVPPRQLKIVESAPKNQPQPALLEKPYRKPGDELPCPFPVIFKLSDGGWEWVRVKDDLFQNPFTESDHLDIRWTSDGREFFFDHNQRGHQLYRILAVDAATGNARVVVEEKSTTFIDHSKKTWRHWLDRTGDLLWMSERSGWCHLWLYSIKTGQVKKQVTQGAWPVREVLHVDEEKREVWFMASGLREGEDPYHLHLCRAGLDGSGFQRLTEGDGNHRVEFSPDRKFFIDAWSRVDHPPVHELRRSSDGSLVCVLETAQADKLLAAGWTIPERFVAKGRDGKTDIHGVIIKPSHFDAKKKYPVVEEVYAGPHSAFAPKDFGRLLRQHQIAELGFVVVQADGMGTNHRGKAFHSVCWKNLKDAGFPDRIAWIKAAAQTRPWMDLKRVGIYGGSAGGQSAMRALLDHHDIYSVAVADCGCHDNRMDKIWWNEQWMGWPADKAYALNSNVDDAHKLEGRLLLIVGELDTNVDPASTTQVVGALQKAGKSFDYMPIIGTGHGAAETPYGSRMRMEFLVRHLQP